LLADTSIAVTKHILTIPRRNGKIDVLLSFPNFATTTAGDEKHTAQPAG